MPRLPALCLFLLLTVCTLVAPGSSGDAAPGRSRVRSGTIRGRLAPASELAGARFYLDAVQVRPRLHRGQFILRGVPPGAHLLTAVSAGGAGAHRTVTVKARGTTQVGALTLAPGGQITGIVSRYDPLTGALAPLGGIEVQAQTFTKLPPGPNDPTTPVPAGDGVALTAVTDETGAYAFRGAPEGLYQVTVAVPELETGVQFVAVQPGYTAVADFQLWPQTLPGAAQLSGMVTRADTGAPVAGAQVAVLTTTSFPPPPPKPGDPPGAPAPSLPPRKSFLTVTDETGHYALTAPAGAVSVVVFADGFEPSTEHLTLEPEEERQLDFILTPIDLPPPMGVGSLEGTVTDAKTGKPVKGAYVGILRGGPAIAPSTVTDGEGHYRLDEIPVGSWTFRAVAGGYQCDLHTVKIVEGTVKAQDFALSPGTPCPEPLAR